MSFLILTLLARWGGMNNVYLLFTAKCSLPLSLFPPRYLWITWNYCYSPGPYRKQRQIFNEGLIVKGILNKQTPHLVFVSPADLPKIYTTIVDSLSENCISLSSVLTVEKRTTQAHICKWQAERVCNRCLQTPWLGAWPWAGTPPEANYILVTGQITLSGSQVPQ